MLLRLPIITVLFQHGEFGAADTVNTAKALLGYCVGLLPFAAVKVLAPAFYSRKDTKTPVRIAVIALVTNMALNLVFVVPMRVLRSVWPRHEYRGPALRSLPLIACLSFAWAAGEFVGYLAGPGRSLVEIE